MTLRHLETPIYLDSIVVVLRVLPSSAHTGARLRILRGHREGQEVQCMAADVVSHGKLLAGSL